MKVFNLACSHGHLFEGWFGSEADYQEQVAQGWLECPVCADRSVSKRPSAPRLNLKAEVPPPAPSPSGVVQGATGLATRAPSAPAWAQAVQRLHEWVAQTEDVGKDFAAEVRAMHQGETAPRPVRGQATLAQATALLEEGIDVLPLPDLAALKHPVQ